MNKFMENPSLLYRRIPNNSDRYSPLEDIKFK